MSHQIDQCFRGHMLGVPDAVVGRLVAHVREHGAAPDERAVHVIVDGEIRAALHAFCAEMESGA